MINENSDPKENIKKLQDSLNKQKERIENIQRRIEAAKAANNKKREEIAKIDLELCQINIKQIETKIKKEKLKAEL